MIASALHLTERPVMCGEIFIPGHLLPLGAVLIEELFRPKKKKKIACYYAAAVAEIT